jgi:hypothetical protein
MSTTVRHAGVEKALVLLFLLACAGPAAVVCAADDITGSWEMTMDFGGRASFATLAITQKADGTLAGKWGAADLSNVKFDGQKLTFARTVKFGDNEFAMNYAGTLKDGKITGAFSTDNGEFAANGARKKPFAAAVGQWDMQYKIGDRDVTGRLALSQKADGALQGKWTSQRGESTISNVKCQDAKLSFDRTSNFNGNEFKSSFEGTVQGDQLTGAFKSERGEMAATGQRFGAALLGEWGLTIVAEQGTFPGRLVVFPDLTGRYELFGGEIPTKSLTFEGDQLAFTVEVGFGDQSSDMTFKGKVDGKTLKGQTTSSFGTAEVTGKKLEAAQPPKAAGVVGTWEFVREAQDGTKRVTTLTIKADMTGTYKMRDTEFPVTALTVNGDQVSFKVTVKYNDNEVPMEFKGKVEGSTLTGAFASERGTREAVSKKVQ